MNKKHPNDEPLTFIIFPNAHKKAKQHPDWIGKVVLEDGTIMRIAGWENTGSKGQYIGGKMTPFYSKEEIEGLKEKKQEDEDDIDDLPF